MDIARAQEISDRDACLALFDSNTPRFFAAAERDGYAPGSDRHDMRLAL